MVPVSKVVGVMLYPCVLGLGLDLNGSHIIKGKVVRGEPNSYFVQQYDGDQVSGHADETTRVTGNIRTGGHIEAKVNAQSHALSIRQAQKVMLSPLVCRSCPLVSPPHIFSK